MISNRFINLEKAELDKPIYRIMPVNRLFESIVNNKNVLVPPNMWDDPFENLLLNYRTRFTVNDIKNGSLIPKSRQLYGQCWTLHKETDAMWRIYSPDKNSAKVKTTPRLLLNALINDSGNSKPSSAYIGKCEYLTQGDLVKKLDLLDIYASEDNVIAESLLYKRKEFSHEKEVRLVYTSGKGDVHKHSINPTDLFHEVIFDPRLDSHLYEAFKSALQSNGYSEKVSKSSLYRLPQKLMHRK